MGRLVVDTFPAGPLGCNCSLLVDREANEAIVVDPGGDLPVIQRRLDALGNPRVSAIVHTHTHIDHVGATAGLAAATNADPQIHEGDRFLYEMLPVQAAMLGIPVPDRCEMKGGLVDGTSFRFGAFELGVLHTPGHTPGSTCFLVEAKEPAEAWLFSGDTLFRGSIGRTDLWGGDFDGIMRSLRERILPLREDAVVVPGHGESSTIADELRQNPFLQKKG